MDYQSIITFFMEMAGTVAFAASGAMVGTKCYTCNNVFG